MKNAPAIIDIEASGFGGESYPIEIGFVLPDGRQQCTLIQPHADWQHWDSSAAAVHGISREVLIAFGKPPAQVAVWLNKNLAGLTIYSDSWGHDYAWLAALYQVANLTPSFKLEHLMLITPDVKAKRWQQIQKEIELELGLKRHRASNDALILQRTWMRLIESNVFEEV